MVSITDPLLHFKTMHYIQVIVTVHTSSCNRLEEANGYQLVRSIQYYKQPTVFLVKHYYSLEQTTDNC